jgi:hypothetical protein
MKRVIACTFACFLVSSCAVPEHDPLMDVPVNMQDGTSSIVMHRPLPVGTRMHVQGVFKHYHRVTAKGSGFVFNEEVKRLQMVYDLKKTLLDLDLSGDPKRVRYEVSSVESSDADIPEFSALGERRSTHIHGPERDQVYFSAGQQFDLAWVDGHTKIAMRQGSLTPVEEAVLTDPFGPAYELWFEAQLAHLFGPKQTKRIGDHWDIDVTSAKVLLDQLGDLVDVKSVSGQASFVSTDRIGAIEVQRIEGFIEATGKIRNSVTYKIRANNNRVKLKYSGAFPVNLNLPPVEHTWSLKGEGQLVIEINDDLGDVRFETLGEHQSRLLDVQR